MAKLTKQAGLITHLQGLVKSAAEAQKNISGTPGGDVKSTSISAEHETTNKNSVGPENQPQGVQQKATDDSSEPLAGAKSAEAIGAEVLDLLMQHKSAAEAQKGIEGKPGADVKSESTEHKPIDKNSVKPENNTQKVEQKGSTDASEPLEGAKKAEAEKIAAEVASYKMGREVAATLFKQAAALELEKQASFLKEAGRRDFELMIAEAQQTLDEPSIKEAAAEGAEAFDTLYAAELEKSAAEGAAYFDQVFQQTTLEKLSAENEALHAKLASYEEAVTSAKQSQASEEAQAKLASTVADIVLAKLQAAEKTA